MSLSRRAFVRTVAGRGADGFSGMVITARGREALVEELWPHAIEEGELAAPADDEILLNSNENPVGPSKRALDAIVEPFGDVGRYPGNADPGLRHLKTEVAKTHEMATDNVVLGAGSGEILRNAVRAYTSSNRHLVTAAPSYERSARLAGLIGTPVSAIPVAAAGKLDLEGMLAASRGAGLVYVCNPNNPTATAHSASEIASFVTAVHRSRPEVTILLDEAYADYVTPGLGSNLPLALRTRNVVVTRTFSKAPGMAGLRAGYALGRSETLRELSRFSIPHTVSTLGCPAAIASLQDPAHIERERQRNGEVRRYTMRFLADAGFEATESQTNFVWVNVRCPAKEFREACLEHKVRVGRDFPPLEKTHVRISLGTMDEMRRATDVFRRVLGMPTTSVARLGAES